MWHTDQSRAEQSDGSQLQGAGKLAAGCTHPLQLPQAHPGAAAQHHSCSHKHRHKIQPPPPQAHRHVPATETGTFAQQQPPAAPASTSQLDPQPAIQLQRPPQPWHRHTAKAACSNPSPPQPRRRSTLLLSNRPSLSARFCLISAANSSNPMPSSWSRSYSLSAAGTVSSARQNSPHSR